MMFCVVEVSNFTTAECQEGPRDTHESLHWRNRCPALHACGSCESSRWRSCCPSSCLLHCLPLPAAAQLFAGPSQPCCAWPCCCLACADLHQGPLLLQQTGLRPPLHWSQQRLRGDPLCGLHVLRAPRTACHQ